MEKLKLEFDKYELEFLSRIIAHELHELGHTQLSGMQLLLNMNLSELLEKMQMKQFPIKDSYSFKLDVGVAYALYHVLRYGLVESKLNDAINATEGNRFPSVNATGLNSNIDFNALPLFHQNFLSVLLMHLDKYLLPVLKRERRNLNQLRISSTDMDSRDATQVETQCIASLQPDLEEKFETWEAECEDMLERVEDQEEAQHSSKWKEQLEAYLHEFDIKPIKCSNPNDIGQSMQFSDVKNYY